MKALTLKKFKTWLESKNSRTKVGRPNICTTCPIAKFLVQTTGNKYEVGEGAYCFTNNRWSDLPKWALNFIEKIDSQRTKSVSAAKCLSILKECA